jgi:hypothetical protein
MFYYVIYNSTVLNYSGNNKNLNTFIYGTVLYILLHGLINSYDNQFAHYIKSYFWVILGIDIFSIYYLYTYINPQEDTDNNNSIKSLLESFYLTKKNQNSDNNTNNNKEKEHKKEKDSHKKDIKKNNDKIKAKNSDDEAENDNENEDNTSNEPIPYQSDDNDNEIIDEQNSISEQMSDGGSDIDLDNFEMSL